jgi:hypothetical protein
MTPVLHTVLLTVNQSILLMAVLINLQTTNNDSCLTYSSPNSQPINFTNGKIDWLIVRRTVCKTRVIVCCL